MEQNLSRYECSRIHNIGIPKSTNRRRYSPKQTLKKKIYRRKKERAWVDSSHEKAVIPREHGLIYRDRRTQSALNRGGSVSSLLISLILFTDQSRIDRRMRALRAATKPSERRRTTPIQSEQRGQRCARCLIRDISSLNPLFGPLPHPSPPPTPYVVKP